MAVEQFLKGLGESGPLPRTYTTLAEAIRKDRYVNDKLHDTHTIAKRMRKEKILLVTEVV